MNTYLISIACGLVVEIIGYCINQGKPPKLFQLLLSKDNEFKAEIQTNKLFRFVGRVLEGVLIAVLAAVILTYYSDDLPHRQRSDDSFISPPVITPTPSSSDFKPKGIFPEPTSGNNIYFDGNGVVKSRTENLNGRWVKWDYYYDSNGAFLYRIGDIGTVESELSSEHMPGTDVSYSELKEPIKNCIGFTLNYQLTDLWAGDGLGSRNVYVFNGQNWIRVDTFSYNDYDPVSIPIILDTPMTIERFTTPRVHEDDYTAFMISQSLSNVKIVDYNQ